MKIILKQDVAKLGKRFDVVEVKDGFAIHFLFPKKLAAPLTKKAITNRDLFLKQQQEQYQKNRALAEKLKLVIEQTPLTFQLKQHDGKPYGSIITKQIINLAKQQRLDLQRFMFKDNVRLQFGEHKLILHLFEEITATLTVIVNPENGTTN